MHRFHVTRADDGRHIAWCDAYPYLVTDGDTWDEALQAAQDAAEMEDERLERDPEDTSDYGW